MLLVIFACAGGFLQALAATILAYAEFLEQSGKKQFTSSQHTLFLVVNILMSMSGIALFVLATGYGPVSLATPLTAGSGLIVNMALQIKLGLSHYTKSMRVGTLVLAIAVTAIVDVGPQEQKDQDALKLLGEPLGFMCMLSVASLIVGGMALAKALDQKPMTSLMKILGYSMLVASSTVLGASLGKLAQMQLPLFSRVVVILLYILMGLFSLLGNSFAAKKTDMSLYMPMYYCLQLLLNCFIGLCVWQDYKVIVSPTGYACVYLLVVLGSYEVSSIDLFENFGAYGVGRHSWNANLVNEVELPVKVDDPDVS